MRPYWHLLLLSLWLNLAAGQNLDAYTSEAPPYQSIHFGLASGYAIDIVKEMARQNGDKITFHFLPWARSFQLARSRANVLLFTLGEADARQAGFTWLGAIADGKPALWKSKTRSDLHPATLEDLRRHRIGVLREDFKTRYLLQQGFQAGTELQFGADELSNLRMLLAGRLDFILVNDGAALIHLARSNGLNPGQLAVAMPLTALSSAQGIAFSPGSDPSLTARYSRTLDSLRKHGFLEQERQLLQLTLSSAQKAD